MLNKFLSFFQKNTEEVKDNTCPVDNCAECELIARLRVIDESINKLTQINNDKIESLLYRLELLFDGNKHVGRYENMRLFLHGIKKYSSSELELIGNIFIELSIEQRKELEIKNRVDILRKERKQIKNILGIE